MSAEIQAKWTAHIFYESRYKKYSKHCVIHLRPVSLKQEYSNSVHIKEAVIKVDGVCFSRVNAKIKIQNILKPTVYFLCREKHATEPVHIKNVFWDEVHFHSIASKNILYPTPFCTLSGDKLYMTLECVTILKCQGEKVGFPFVGSKILTFSIFFLFFLISLICDYVI